MQELENGGLIRPGDIAHGDNDQSMCLFVITSEKFAFWIKIANQTPK